MKKRGYRVEKESSCNSQLVLVVPLLSLLLFCSVRKGNECCVWLLSVWSGVEWRRLVVCVA